MEAYSEATLSHKNCPRLFHKFKNGDFEVGGKTCEALLEEDPYQTQEEVTQPLLYLKKDDHIDSQARQSWKKRNVFYKTNLDLYMI